MVSLNLGNLDQVINWFDQLIYYLVDLGRHQVQPDVTSTVINLVLLTDLNCLSMDSGLPENLSPLVRIVL